MEKIAGLVDKFLIHSSYLRATNYSDSFVPFYFMSPLRVQLILLPKEIRKGNTLLS